VYPGCSQSRHPNETGSKGCCLVTMSDTAAPDIRFTPTDVVRYHQGSVDISPCDSIDSVRRAIVGVCRTVSEDSQGRHAIVRLALTGRSALHRELARAGNMDTLVHAVREEVESWEPWVWPEKLPLETRGTYDIEMQRGREDFVGDLVSVYDTLLDPSSGRLEERAREMDDALVSWQGYRFLKDKPEEAAVANDELAAIADEARRLTLDRVVEES
jgi:exonuclease SbcD